ncbi:MAG TPA: choice-of-anchor R domain-containing protein [Blastocatellia bacterium]
MHRRWWFLWVFMAAFAQPPDLIWTTLGSGKYAAGFSVGLLNVNANRQWAVALKPSCTCTLSSLAVPLSLDASPGVMKLALMTDVNGAPGTPIETFTVTGIHGEAPTLYTIDSVIHPRLEAWTEYWIVAQAAGPTRITWWSRPNTAKNSASNGVPQAFRENSGPWSAIWAPEVPGVAVTGIMPAKL